jgi:hypothetical protein
MLSISVVARSNGVLKQLVLQAKKEARPSIHDLMPRADILKYEQECVDRVQIYVRNTRYHAEPRLTPLPSLRISMDPGDGPTADTRGLYHPLF